MRLRSRFADATAPHERSQRGTEEGLAKTAALLGEKPVKLRADQVSGAEKQRYCAKRRGERPLRRMVAHVGGDDRAEAGHHDTEQDRGSAGPGPQPARTSSGQAPIATKPHSKAGRRPMRSESRPSSTPPAAIESPTNP